MITSTYSLQTTILKSVIVLITCLFFSFNAIGQTNAQGDLYLVSVSSENSDQLDRELFLAVLNQAHSLRYSTNVNQATLLSYLSQSQENYNRWLSVSTGLSEEQKSQIIQNHIDKKLSIADIDQYLKMAVLKTQI